MSKISFGFLILITSLFFDACEKAMNKQPIQDKFESYFGLTPGRFIIYNVREISHDETADIKHDTINYQLKTVIGDTIIDNAGRIARKYLRFKRANTTEKWVLLDVWTTLIDGNFAELVEENQRVIKMLFPVSSKTTWNQNAFNSNSSLNCSYDKVHKSLWQNGMQFDSTLRIEQENKRNLVEYKRKYEVYGNRIGMISKNFKDLKISNFDTLNIKSGHEIIYTCTDFGIE
jgi:hypothetical protein